MTIVIEIDGKAVAKGRGRVGMVGGHPTVFTPAATRSYENLIKLKASQVMAGKLPIEGPVDVRALVYIAIPDSFSKKKKAHALEGVIRPCVKPDSDNFLKSCLDGLNAIVIADDKQAVDCHVHKFYSMKPRMRIEVRELFPVGII